MKVDFSFLVSAVCSIDLSESEQDVWRMPLHSSMYSYDSKRLQTRVPSMEQVNTAMFIHSMRTSPPVASRSMVSLEDQVKHVANKKKQEMVSLTKEKPTLERSLWIQGFTWIQHENPEWFEWEHETETHETHCSPARPTWPTVSYRNSYWHQFYIPVWLVQIRIETDLIHVTPCKSNTAIPKYFENDAVWKGKHCNSIKNTSIYIALGSI